MVIETMNAHRRARGFTLIELLVVMAIVALLVALASPRYFSSLSRSKETALQQTLAVVRDSIDKFYADHGKYPDDLAMLVDRRYLRSLPADPITGSAGSWLVVAPADPEQGGLYDIQSGADGVGRNGKPFREW